MIDGCAASKMSEKVRQRVKLEFAVDSPCKDGLVLSQLERSLETDIAHKVRAASAVKVENLWRGNAIFGVGP